MASTENEGNHADLRVQLVNVLAEADKCDSIVAIHIETALALLDERVLAQSRVR